MDRQRIILIFGIALLSAAGLTWFLYANTVVPKQEKKLVVLAAAHDLPVGSLIKPRDMRRISLGTRDVPRGAVTTDKEALNRVVLYPMSINEPLLLSKLSNTTSAEGVAATIEPGYRAVSVQITDVNAVSGLIQPGSRVDVVFTRPGSMAEAITSTILQNVRVLAIGRTLSVGGPADPKAPKASAATLVVTPVDAQKLELAKNQGKISLTLRNPQDTISGETGPPMTTEVLDPVISARLARARRGRTTNIKGSPNLDDPRIWQELTGEKKPQDDKPKVAEKREPPPPRAVIDVFRGNKHVQETFK
jgi:pilus assembly protein CpaB